MAQRFVVDLELGDKVGRICSNSSKFERKVKKVDFRGSDIEAVSRLR